MTGPNFIDEIDCGSFFDHIDDLLDFHGEDIEAGLPVGKPDSLPSIWSAQPEPLPGSDAVFSGNSSSSLSAELSVPYEDIVQLEWLSTFVEESFSGGSLTMSKEQVSNGGGGGGGGSGGGNNTDSSSQQFQTSSPVSVLESSSSCSVDNKPRPPSPEAINPARCGRARSKRPRPANFNPRPAIQLAPQQSSDVAENEPGSENSEESNCLPVIKAPKKQASGGAEPKKKKIKFTMPPAPPAEADQGLPQQAVRKCLHCEITKTPQWRAGPLGPKTLCNACGVRYKSGRLYPEYRPAASPTFIPSLHSNSHKKVLEMRTKTTDNADDSGTASAVPDSLELIPNMSGWITCED